MALLPKGSLPSCATAKLWRPALPIATVFDRCENEAQSSLLWELDVTRAVSWLRLARPTHFHSQIVVCVLPAASTSNSKAPATPFRRAKASEVLVKMRHPR
jgi:hypothetical protein